MGHPLPRNRAYVSPIDVGDLRRAELRRWQERLPGDGCLTGLTAAELRGWWSLPGGAGAPVFAAVPEDAPHPEPAGLVVTRHAVAPRFDTLPDGLRVARPGETLLGCWSLNGLDLVLLLDAALAVGEDPDEITTTARLRRRGAPSLRRALEECSPRSDSLWESVQRVFHQRMGVEVEPQAELDTAGGRLYADLRIVGTRRIHEYDGAHHLDPAQQRSDLRRARALVALGLERNGYTSHDLLVRPVAVLADIDQAVGRVHDPARVRPWVETLRTSLLTPSGRNAARQRWELAAAGRAARRGPRRRAGGGGADRPVATVDVPPAA